MKALDATDDLAAVRARFRDEMLTLLGRNDGKGDRLRAKAARLEREHGPVKLATFEPDPRARVAAMNATSRVAPHGSA